MKKKHFVILVMGVALVVAFSGCKSKTSDYNVSGVITTEDEKGVPDVKIGFSGVSAVATTDRDGKWSKSRLEGSVTVTPVSPKDGFNWEFQPAAKTVSEAATDVNFSVKDLLYYDGFSDPESGWPEDEDLIIGYKDNEYEIKIQRKSYICWSFWEIFPKDYRILMDVRRHEGEDGVGGIVFNAVNEKFLYGFVVRPNTQQYSLYCYDLAEEAFAEEIPWTSSTHIKNGGDINRLEVVQKSEIACFYINENLVGEFNIDQHASDNVGIGMCAGTTTNPVTFRFDDLQVFSPEEDEDEVGADYTGSAKAFPRTKAAKFGGEFWR